MSVGRLGPELSGRQPLGTQQHWREYGSSESWAELLAEGGSRNRLAYTGRKERREGWRGEKGTGEGVLSGAGASQLPGEIQVGVR